MKFKHMFVLIITFLIITESKLHHWEQTRQQQDLDYLQSLSKKQSQIKQSLKALKTQINTLDSKLKQVQGLPNMKTIALQQGLADERDLLYNLQQKSTIPFKLKSVDCKDISQQQKKDITQSITSIEDELKKLEGKVSTLDDNCSICVELKKQYQWDLLYLKQLKEINANPCPVLKPHGTIPTNIIGHTKIPNLKAQNWIYGDTTQAQVYAKIFEKSSVLNVTKCKIQTPYVLKDQQECSACPEKQYYDLSKEVCVECPQGTLFNKQQHKCKKNQPNTSCQNGKFYNFEQKKCECPKTTPYWNDKKCLGCESSQYFNEQTKQCAVCPESSEYNLKQKKCEKCPEDKPLVVDGKCSSCSKDSYFDQNTKKCLKCEGNRQWNRQANKCQCPADKPYLKQQLCISCEKSQYYNEKTLKCDVCPKNFIYNKQNKNCVQCPQNSPIFDGTNCVSCPKNSIYNSTQKLCISCPQSFVFSNGKCICPTTAPFNDGVKCISCYLPKYWNLDDKTCEFCNIGHYYNTHIKKCQLCPQDKPLSVEGICQPCPAKQVYNKQKNICEQGGAKCENGMIYDSNSNKCKCPRLKPFFNDKQCVQCFLPKYWSIDKKSCESCPQHQVYNTQRKICDFCPSSTPLISGFECVKCPQGLIFESSTYRCVQLVQTKTKCNPGYIFDKKNNKCICGGSTPFDTGSGCVHCYLPQYWDNQKRQCLYCPQHTVYDTKIKLCSKCPSDKPKIAENGYHCVACPQKTLFDEKKFDCISYDKFCPSTFKLDEDTKKCVCPKETPFNDGTKCVSCYLPKYWDIPKRQCLDCPENTKYDTKIRRCI